MSPKPLAWCPEYLLHEFGCKVQSAIRVHLRVGTLDGENRVDVPRWCRRAREIFGPVAATDRPHGCPCRTDFMGMEQREQLRYHFAFGFEVLPIGIRIHA